MPDYNPAVALDIKPPENNLAKTFDTIANIQQAQAHTGLYTLQEAQQARRLEGYRQMAAAYRSGQDPVPAGMAYGVDAADLNQMQTLEGNRRAMAMTPGNIPTGAYEQLMGAREKAAQIGKIGAETGKIGIETQTAELGRSKAADEAALRKANMFLANPDQPQFLADAMDAHNKADPPANELEATRRYKLKQQLLNAPIEQQMAVARAYGAIDPTNEQKNAAASGLNSPLEFDTRKKIAETDVGIYGKVLQGLSGQANTAAAMIPNIQMTKALINDPGFYSGTAEGTMLAFKKAAAALGVSKEDAAVPQEAFRKVMAANILHQVDDIKAASAEMGSSTSRIFASQIDLMEKAAQNPDNSVAGNRFLAEVQERAANRSMKIGDMAADYKLQHGKLDEGFIKDLRKWSVDNPMFTKEELANPKSLAAPPAKSAQAMPKVGESRRGYTFKGGNPADQNSWEKE